MSDESMAVKIECILNILEDKTLDIKIVTKNYVEIYDILKASENIDNTLLKRLFDFCIADLMSDPTKKCKEHLFDLINFILTEIKDGKLPPPSNIFKSLLDIQECMSTNYQETCFRTVLAFPDNVIIDLVTSNSPDVVNFLSDRLKQTHSELVVLAVDFIYKILKLLPRDKREEFVHTNLSLWFQKVIPTIVLYAAKDISCSSSTLVDTMEVLTDDIIKQEYADHLCWIPVLDCIINPNKYPLIMKNMLENGSDCWHRMWMSFIRLLKNQITRTSNPNGSPINSMLPVVETAFKMDVQNRCRAFDCWNVLIDNFYTETNEVYIVKRLKLLVIPLKSNNAKVEKTALAKMNTWWHLIYRFETRLYVSIDGILISYLHYCFGKPNSPQSFVPGLFTESSKKLAVYTFIELAGHLSCEGCVDTPRLSGRVITKKLFTDYWNDWIHCFNVTLSIFSQSTGYSLNQLVCVWKSFLLIISELPDNNIKSDMFKEYLSALDVLMEIPDASSKATEIVFTLVKSLFDDENIKQLLLTKSDERGPLHKLISLVMKPVFISYYRSLNTVDAVATLKLIANSILDVKLCLPGQMIKWMFDDISLRDNISFLWMALAESMVETYHCNISNIETVLLWPLNTNVPNISDIKYSSSIWHELFKHDYSLLPESVHEKVLNFLWNDEKSDFSLMLKLYAALEIINQDMVKNCDYNRHIELILEISNRKESCIAIEKMSKLFMSALITVMKKVDSQIKVKCVKSVLKCVKNVIKLTITECEKNVTLTDSLSLENLLKELNEFLKNKLVSSVASIIVDVLMKLPLIIKSYPSLNEIILSILNICLNNFNSDVSLYKDIKQAIESIPPKVQPNNSMQPDKFSTPNTKIVTRKSKKREANIVSTVVENGEQFVVVRSNWKFNPRKLTENQKEKLQRKREDIPALYQDLSQSQDEFKLNTWKTDSQDSSSTLSKSTSVSKQSDVNDVNSVLKNMPSSDVVPNIIENIFSENTNKAPSMVKSATNSPNSVKQLITPKDTKSPRLALKDRVFRNVRNLIEKSNLSSNSKELSENLAPLEDITKTPASKCVENITQTNSAPPKINAERPSRVKRKPKKFDDTELFALKKGRYSLNQSELQTDSEVLIEPLTDNELAKTDENIVATIEEVKPSTNVDADIKNVEIKDNEREIKNDETEIINNDTETKNDKIVKKNDEIDIKNNKTDKLHIDKPDVEVSNSNIETIEEQANTHKIQISKNIKVSESEKNISSEMILANDEQDRNKHTNFKVSDIHFEKNGITDPKATVTKTPKSTKKHAISSNKKSTADKTSNKKSRIEKELAIDTVEGHPLLSQIQPEKRTTRKNLTIVMNNSRRKSVSEKIKSKLDTKTPKSTLQNSKKIDKVATEPFTFSDSEVNSQICSDISIDMPLSEDIIESSQDSTLTTISVGSTKSSIKKVAVAIDKAVLPMALKLDSANVDSITIEKNICKASEGEVESGVCDYKDDTVLPENKTVSADNSALNDTENMDTEPLSNNIEMKENLSDVIVINDDEELPIVISSEDICVGPETQEIAEADTQPTDPKDFTNDVDCEVIDVIDVNTEEDVTSTISSSINNSLLSEEVNSVSSPFKDEELRKKDFLDNTLEISPIKTMSPVKDKKCPSPETSSDYLVIKLSSPVQSNGEPFEKCDSPEIFTEDKISPDKRDMSPPRVESSANSNNSPSSSLSLKKNRPQVRSGGRAAQMLGLCVPDRLQTIMTSDKTVPEDVKKSSPCSTPVRRNLRILYNSVGDGGDISEDTEESENFLKFKRCLPSTDCSPSGPILKRKLIDITDEATISPASKRKRVSFHDPPVSTTIAVQKYIEPSGVKSPQNSLLKRAERQHLRSQQIVVKSPKRLDCVFKLDSVLTKAVESFSDVNQTSTDETQSLSLDETPAVEIVKNSDLNEMDPIYPDLVDCNDPIDNIAAGLSSVSMKTVFLKEIEGKLKTIGDLARMTELEVNRLCIKAPKLKVAKKVLKVYASLKNLVEQPETEPVAELINDATPLDVATKSNIDNETQTNMVVLEETEMQTEVCAMTSASVQTNVTETQHCHVQTIESGFKSTKDIIVSCLLEKPDFIQVLNDNIGEPAKREIAEKLPSNIMTEAFMHHVSSENSQGLIARICETQNNHDRKKELSFLQDYLCNRFDSKDLTLFCSKLLQKIHDKLS